MIDIDGPVTLIAVTGQYDLLRRGWLPDHTLAAINEGRGPITIDLDGLDFADATLLSDIVICRRHAASKGMALHVVAASPRWHRPFELGGLQQVVIHPPVPRQSRRLM